MPSASRIELDRSLDSIKVGARHRRDLGDLASLKDSIALLGLLQPPTIASDGTLLCGRRRLEAMRELGWRTTKVCVRSDITDDLHSLLAQQHDNSLHKELGIVEAANLYRELKAVMVEDAAKRQQASQFGYESGQDGVLANLAAPEAAGDSRRQAAETVTGKAAYTRLEQVNALQGIAANPDESPVIRGLAAAALEHVESGAPVTRTFSAVQDVCSRPEPLTGEDELERLAREALERIKQPRTRRTPASLPKRTRSVRAFVHTWTDMDGWSRTYDPDEVGAELTAKEWALFEQVLEETKAFHEAAGAARMAEGDDQ